MTPVILLQSDVIQLLANIMESVDREDIIAKNDIENSQPTVACNTCQICYKSFSTKRSLKQHRNIHEDLKRFPCLLCKKTFSEAGSLKRHKLAQVVRRHSLEQVP